MKYNRFYFTALLSALLLGVFGILTILSSQSGAEQPFLLASRQGIFFASGIAVLFGTAAVPFRIFRKLRLPGCVFFLGLLLLLPCFGTRINGMCGWFRFGSFSLQPAELAKPFFVLGLAVLLSGNGSERRRFTWSALFCSCWLGAVLLQPDLGTAAVYFAVFLLMLFVSALPWRFLIGTLAAGIAGSVFFLLRYPYALKRITGLLGSNDDWHIRQFELAAARGGWFGSKLGNAYWSNGYLPLPYNDSAYASLFETIGCAGALIVLLLFALLVASLAVLSWRQRKDPASSLFIAGCAILTGFQSLIHIGVNLSLLPPTGLNLPLVSYGGSSMTGCCLLLGMAFSAAFPPETADIDRKNQNPLDN